MEEFFLAPKLWLHNMEHISICFYVVTLGRRERICHVIAHIKTIGYTYLSVRSVYRIY